MDIDYFCDLADIENHSETEKAILFIWFHIRDKKKPTCSLSEIISMFRETHLGTPNSSRLSGRLRQDRRVRQRVDIGKNEFTLERSTLKYFDQNFNYQPPEEFEIITPFYQQLQRHVDDINDDRTREFLLEAIACLKGGLRRAAIVLSWQGAYYVLVQNAFRSHLNEFNQAALKTNAIKKKIERIEQFQRLKESETLICLEHCGMISKSVKSALEECLNRRNNCGHPNDYKITDSQVAAHIESLIVHVFEA